ncbi:MAG: ABC transporter substrate-binding protein, partial [Burkholderiales bacterium]
MKRLGTFVAVAFALALGSAHAQQKEIKIGVIYDYTGPFAAGGSVAAGIGTKIAIDMINEKGGVDGYKIHPIYADAQSKAEV